MVTPEMKTQKDSVLWVGGEDSMESELVKRAGIPFEAIPAAGVHGVGVKALPGNLIKLGKGYLEARKIMARYRPDVLFFTGGYVAIPMGLASRLFSGTKLRPRILLFIPDIEPGQALRVLTYFADHITVSTKEARRYLPARKSITYTGYPVRKELISWERDQALSHFMLQEDIPTLLVFGGSSGARSINEALLDSLPGLLPEIQVLHVSGERDWEIVQQRLESRAGAAILGEYPQFGLPSVLVPYPHAWRYQRTNAQYLVSRGGAVLLEDTDLKDQLIPVVFDLIKNPEKLKTMNRVLKSLAAPDAANAIAEIIKNFPSTNEDSRT
jgi:UDP-N-acetylglucosamine--N-acetylmuramyl-(pentapeptide) pyrophosphoryl-undecaprenol N-acetylglucosamine transferase